VRVLALTLATWTLLSTPESSARGQDLASRFDDARLAIAQGRYVDAEATAQVLVSMAEDAAVPRLLEARDLLVEALVCNGRGPEPRTRSLAEDVLAERRLASSSFDENLGVSIRNLGDVLFEAGDYAEAVARFREALRIHDSAPNPGLPLLVLRDLERLSRALHETQYDDEALALADRALTLGERTPTARATDLAKALEARALVSERKGDYSKARVDLERAVALLEADYPSGHPETANALTLLSAQLSREGNLLQSQNMIHRAAAMAEARYRPGHPQIAFTLRFLAHSYSDAGNLGEGISLSRLALQIAEQSFSKDHPLVAVQLNDLAVALMFDGQYVAARSMFERALAIYTKREGATSVRAAATLYNLGVISHKLGDLPEARREFEKVSVMWAMSKGPRHPDVARALSALGETLADQGLDREAIPVYRRAIAIQEMTLGANHPFIAGALSTLSASLARVGDLKQALALSQRALAIWEQASSVEGIDQATSLMQHGEILTRMGDFDAARRTYERAADIRRTSLGEAHPQVAAADVALSAVEAALGETDDAAARALSGEHIGLGHLKLLLASVPEREALDYAATRPKGLGIALSLLPQRGNVNAALDALILERSVVLDEMAARHRSTAESADPEIAGLWQSFASARKQLADLVIRGPDNRQTSSYSSLVAAAQKEKERTEQALAERSLEFRAERSRSAVGLADVRSHLPDGAALVSFVRYNKSTLTAPAQTSSGSGARLRDIPSYAAFVLRSGNPDAVFVPLGRADSLEDLIASWRTAMMTSLKPTPDATNGTPAAPSFRSLGVMLTRRVWDPLASSLAGVNRVFVVPDGQLNLVSLAALPSGSSHYLVEDGPTLHYLSAERDIVPTEPAQSHRVAGLLTIGGPAFANTSSLTERTQTQTTVAAASASVSFRGALSNCIGLQAMRFDPLPGTRVEAEAVARLWNRLGPGIASTEESATVLTGTNATESAFKTLSAHHRVLHLATHGFFLGDGCATATVGTRSVGGLVSASSANDSKPPRATTRVRTAPENPLVLSGLAFAGANRRAAAAPGEDDGILTAEEVASMNLEGVDWAVLSACDTGLGTVTAGEGVLGLRRAFQIAGVHTVIMSLWSVEDLATQQWMEALYRARLGDHLDTADAVRQANLTLIRERRARGQSTNPFFWAAFVAAGDWR
jgi:CHAT domain-containing protein/tetratricopeptide (TPR) repeat protein